MNSLTQSQANFNPHAQPFTPCAAQAGDALRFPSRAMQTKLRNREKNVREKLLGREFLHIEGRPCSFTVKGGKDGNYILNCAEHLGELIPVGCGCPAVGECGHRDAMERILAFIRPDAALRSCSRADGVACQYCGSPAIKITSLVGPRGFLFDVVCVDRLFGKCFGRIL